MKNLYTACLLACGLTLGSTAFAGAGDATMSVADTTASVGASFTMTAVLDNNLGDVQGWSFGLCHTASLATIDSVDDADTATVKNGSPADFNEKSTFTDGFTQGVVICFTGCAVIPGGTTGFQMATGNYTATTEGTGVVEFCGTLGSPPTAVVVVVGGASVPPVESNGILDIIGVPAPEFNYIAGSSTGNNYPAGSGIGGQTFNVGFSIEEVDNSASGGLFPSNTQGFSQGFSNDDSLVTPTAVNVTLPFTADFAESGLFTNGWTLGVVYAFTGGVELQFDSALEVAKEMDALAEKINDAKSKIEEIDQNEDSIIVITDHWDRKICKVQLEDWAGEYISLLESLNSLSAEQHALFIQMKNCVNVGLNDLKSMIARNKGEEPKIYKGLSIAQESR